MSNFQDISMQWLHFVNELHCYKGKENKKQLLKMTPVVCSPIKNQSYMPENYWQNKEFAWVFRFFYLDLQIKFLKRKCLGSSRPPPPSPSKKRVKVLVMTEKKIINIFAIKYFSCKSCNPLKKVTSFPPFSFLIVYPEILYLSTFFCSNK